MADALLQVAPDGAGKQVDMESVKTTASTSIIYQQRAQLVGAPADSIHQLLEVNRLILANMRALVTMMSAFNPHSVTEDDFLNSD